MIKRLLALSLVVVAACGESDHCKVGTPGACDGDTFVACSPEGKTVVTDCTQMGLACGTVDAMTGAGCVDECAQAGVAPTGACAPGGIRVCDGAGHLSFQTCADNLRCDDTGGMPACVVDSCDAVGPSGRCAGTTFTSCASGAPVYTDCAAAGQVCAYISDAAGYGCAAGSAPRVLAGVVRYEDKPPLMTGKLGPIQALPVRGGTIAVINDADKSVLAMAITADDGSYRIYYDAPDATSVHLSAIARNPTTARPGRVQSPGSGVPAFGGDSFIVAPELDVDLLVTDKSRVSEAFNILDQVTGTFDLIRNQLHHATPRSLTLVWGPGNADGTYYDGSVHLLGEIADDDGYDDTVILHETGHYVEATEGRTDSPGGSHDGGATDPRLAWSEGWATYWEMAVRNKSNYMDSNASGGWSYDADTSVTAASLAGGMTQNVSEDMVTEILWDLADGPTNDDDSVSSGHGNVVRVQSEYLKTATLRAVGTVGVDLVDFLDGWFLSQGLTPCAGAKAIITTTRQFPYDYAGPAGQCP